MLRRHFIIKSVKKPHENRTKWTPEMVSRDPIQCVILFILLNYITVTLLSVLIIVNLTGCEIKRRGRAAWKQLETDRWDPQ
jgi:hypothetical protein